MSGNFVNVIATKSGPGLEKVMADIREKYRQDPESFKR